MITLLVCSEVLEVLLAIELIALGDPGRVSLILLEELFLSFLLGLLALIDQLLLSLIVHIEGDNIGAGYRCERKGCSEDACSGYM